MGRFDRNELLAALAVVAFGLVWLAIAATYPMGTLVRAGAGFFPAALSVVLIVIGFVLAWQSRSEASDALDLRPRPAVLILGGILAWALLVDRIGFLPATAILVALCALAERESTWLSAVGTTVFLCLFGYVVFIEGLGIPLSLIGD